MIGMDTKTTKLPYKTCFSLFCEEDKDKMQLRLQSYHKKLIILHNLAQKDADVERLQETETFRVIHHGSTSEYLFNLRKDYRNEFLPLLVQRVLNYSLLAQHESLSFLPSFVSISRIYSEISIKVTSAATRLRDLLYDRDLVKDRGTIIC